MKILKIINDILSMVLIVFCILFSIYGVGILLAILLNI